MPKKALSSNRIEGIEAPPDRIKRLVEQKTRPQNRSEQEIAGYRDVLATIHANHANISFTTSGVLQFHRDLYQFVPQQSGRWKPIDNEIIETRADGTRVVRFKPVSAHQTPEIMEKLHSSFKDYWENREIDPLLLIPAYVLDFLCIHPFLDGNGRMARLLTLLLLYHAGYKVGRYISLEHLIEAHREGYYDALFRSSQGWHDGNHSLTPWWEYFLGVILLGAYQEFERRTGELTNAHGAKTEMAGEMQFGKKGGHDPVNGFINGYYSTGCGFAGFSVWLPEGLVKAVVGRQVGGETPSCMKSFKDPLILRVAFLHTSLIFSR